MGDGGGGDGAVAAGRRRGCLGVLLPRRLPQLPPRRRTARLRHRPVHQVLPHQVMYDAPGVRLHAGKQVLVSDCTLESKQRYVLNQIVCELPAEHPLAETRPLRGLLGHTPIQGEITVDVFTGL